LQRATRTEEVTQVLREEVLRGQYRPGERLPSERDLAARFKTTRGVVRVALKKLEQLGIADVQPGGTRVVAVSEASLDVVGHLLDLESPPDPDLVDQVLEVLGALRAATARIAVERGDRGKLERARALIRQLHEPDLDEDKHFELAHELGQVFMDATDNVVLQIVRRGLRTQIVEHLRDAPWRPRLAPGRTQQLAKQLDRAIEKRDPTAASDAVIALERELRKMVRRSLEEARGERRLAGAV
jgi:GntR family transcriptional repressor for pyruvate dehydrogenase complex